MIRVAHLMWVLSSLRHLRGMSVPIWLGRFGRHVMRSKSRSPGNVHQATYLAWRQGNPDDRYAVVCARHDVFDIHAHAFVHNGFPQVIGHLVSDLPDLEQTFCQRT